MRPRLCAALVCAAVIGPAAAADAATHTIRTVGNPGSYAYEPSSLVVLSGDTVEWQASGTHPLVFDAGGGPFTSNQQRTLSTPGTIAFHCMNHGAAGGVGMSGIVRVNAPPTITVERDTASPSVGQPVTFHAVAGDADGTVARIDWDLDGDGAFETTGATASASYAAGTHTVRARVTDDLGATATASHSFTVPGASPGSDNQAPSLETRAPKSIRAGKLRRRGVKLTLTASEDARLVAELRNRRGRRLGRATAQARAGKVTILRVHAKKAKVGRLKLRIVAIDAAGNRERVTRRLEVE